MRKESSQHSESEEKHEPDKDIDFREVNSTLKVEDVHYISSLLDICHQSGQTGETVTELEKQYRELVGCEYNDPYYFQSELASSEIAQQYEIKLVTASPSSIYAVLPDGRILQDLSGDNIYLGREYIGNHDGLRGFQVISDSRFLSYGNNVKDYELGDDGKFHAKTLDNLIICKQGWVGQNGEFIFCSTTNRLSAFMGIGGHFEINSIVQQNLGDFREFQPMPNHRAVVRLYAEIQFVKYDFEKIDLSDPIKTKFHTEAMAVSRDGRVFIVHGLGEISVYNFDGTEPILVEEFRLNISFGGGADDMDIGSIQVIGKDKLLISVNNSENPLVVVEKINGKWETESILDDSDFSHPLKSAQMIKNGTIVAQDNNNFLYSLKPIVLGKGDQNE